MRNRTSSVGSRRRWRGNVAAAAVAAVVLLVPSLAMAQQIGGTVSDSTGAVLPGVTVEAASPALIEKVRSVVTNDTGEYLIVALQPGVYTVTFTLPGFKSIVREGVKLSTGFTADIDAQLAVGPSRKRSRLQARAPSSISGTSTSARP